MEVFGIEYVDHKEVQEMFGCSRGHLYKLRKDPKFPKETRYLGELYWRKSEIEKYIRTLFLGG
jgi:predicted DNA-binding transcriptional regulator AlpA